MNIDDEVLINKAYVYQNQYSNMNQVYPSKGKPVFEQVYQVSNKLHELSITRDMHKSPVVVHREYLDLLNEINSRPVDKSPTKEDWERLEGIMAQATTWLYYQGLYEAEQRRHEEEKERLFKEAIQNTKAVYTWAEIKEDAIWNTISQPPKEQKLRSTNRPPWADLNNDYNTKKK